MGAYFFSRFTSNGLFIKLIATTSIFLAGAFIGYIFRGIFSDHNKLLSRHFEVREGGYQYISPLLECESDGDAEENTELKPFKHKIEEYIAVEEKNKLVQSVSVYFRDLNNGPWFAIGETENFAPASLLKVPLMMAVLKDAETDLKILGKKIKNDDPIDYSSDQNVKPAAKLEYGKTYSMNELLYRMIVYSDNNAFRLVEKNANTEAVKKTYHELGITSPYIAEQDNFMTIHAYASFFRILFNASFLNREMSEKALSYLTKVEFKNGLIAGVPANITVAHKFGERGFTSMNSLRQLHDCGIIYYPGHPYLLCIMTRGNSFRHLDDGIKNISHIVYKEIDRQHRH